MRPCATRAPGGAGGGGRGRPLADVATLALRTALHTALLGEPLADRLPLVTSELRAAAFRGGVGEEQLQLALERAWLAIPEACYLPPHGMREELLDRLLRACSADAASPAAPRGGTA